MRKLLCLLLIVFGAETYAASTPIKSKYDDRIQSQIYNALDVTKVSCERWIFYRNHFCR